MRFESATVPAAVKPGHAKHDDGFCEIPATVRKSADGKASRNRDKSEDLPDNKFKAFGKKSKESPYDSFL